MVKSEQPAEREQREIRVDGAQGEGGGQVLRTSLAASMCLRRPVHIHSIRAHRPKPGLRRQHLAAIEAAARICGARVAGASLGSGEIRFTPGAIEGGTYSFDIGSAGSTTLVLQTLLPALMTATVPTSVRVRGGTHNPLAPPFEFFALAYLPLLRRMGARVEARLVRHGFLPGGNGEVRLDVEPGNRLRPLHLVTRGALSGIEASIKLANLPSHIAERERQVLLDQLGLAPGMAMIEEVEASGPGNIVVVCVHSDALTEVFTAFGRRGLRAEAVARHAATEARRYLAGSAVVGPYLADQLLLPLALAGAGTFTTGRPTSHATTQASLMSRLFGLPVLVQPLAAAVWQVSVGADTRPSGLLD